MSLQPKACGRLAVEVKEAQQMRGERVPVARSLAQSLHVGKAVGESGIERDEFDGTASGGNDAARGHHLHGNVHDDCAGVEEIERPHVHRAAGKIDAAGGARQHSLRLPGNICGHR